MKPILLPLLVLAAACGAANDPDRSQESSRSSSSDSGRTLFVQSAVEHSDGTVTLPLYRGTSRGRTVWYILLDSSSDNDAQARGINKSQKLANARGSKAVQKVAGQRHGPRPQGDGHRLREAHRHPRGDARFPGRQGGPVPLHRLARKISATRYCFLSTVDIILE